MGAQIAFRLHTQVCAYVVKNLDIVRGNQECTYVIVIFRMASWRCNRDIAGPITAWGVDYTIVFSNDYFIIWGLYTAPMAESLQFVFIVACY